MNTDLISRQAAIDRLIEHLNDTDVFKSYPGMKSAIAEWLNELPSTQLNRVNSINNSIDLISRQAAIDAISEGVRDDAFLLVALIKSKINKVPSAQPDTPTHGSIPAETAGNHTNRTTDDCISRAEAIRVASGYCHPANIAKELAKLPSAQSEIIRCKDCKYRMPYDWMFSEVWQSQNIDDYPDNEIGCQYCDMRMTADDFCSRAERRTDG